MILYNELTRKHLMHQPFTDSKDFYQTAYKMRPNLTAFRSHEVLQVSIRNSSIFKTHHFHRF